MPDDAIPKAFNLSGICIFGEKLADSKEHIIPSALGGQVDPPILCGFHNGKVNECCDEPLIKALQFFVHALRVRKDRNRGEDGTPLKAVTADGKTYTIDRNFQPVIPREIDRSKDGRPVSAKFPNEEGARKFVKSMGLDPSLISFEVRTEAIPEVYVRQLQVSEDILRGVLKIGFEFVRGLYDAPIIDAEAEAGIRRALIDGEDPSKFVRWLPYEYAPELPTVEYPHHRIIAWHDDAETLAIVELFNCMPFVLRLPGIAIRAAPYYVKGVHGQVSIYNEVFPIPDWHWSDIPEHGAIADRQVFGERVLSNARAMIALSLVMLTEEAVEAQLAADGKVHDAEAVLAAVESRCSRRLTDEQGEMILCLARLCVAGPYGA